MFTNKKERGILTIGFFISGVMQMGKRSHFQNEDLRRLIDNIPQLIQSSRDCIAAYTSTYRRFELWASNFQELQVYPKNDYPITLYIMFLIHEDKSVATMKQFTASCAWIHKFVHLKIRANRTLFTPSWQEYKVETTKLHYTRNQ